MTSAAIDEKWARVTRRAFGLDGEKAKWQSVGWPDGKFTVTIDGKEYSYGGRLAKLKSSVVNVYAGPREAAALQAAGASLVPAGPTGLTGPDKYKIAPGSMQTEFQTKASTRNFLYVRAIYQAINEGKMEKGKLPPRNLPITLSKTGEVVHLGDHLRKLAEPRTTFALTTPEIEALKFAEIRTTARVGRTGEPVGGMQIDPDMRPPRFPSAAQYGPARWQDHEQAYELDPGFGTALGYGQELTLGYSQGAELEPLAYVDPFVMPQSFVPDIPVPNPWLPQYNTAAYLSNDAAAIDYFTSADTLQAAAGPAAAFQNEYTALPQHFGGTQDFSPGGTDLWPAALGTSDFTQYAGRPQLNSIPTDQPYAAPYNAAAQHRHQNPGTGTQQRGR